MQPFVNILVLMTVILAGVHKQFRRVPKRETSRGRKILLLTSLLITVHGFSQQWLPLGGGVLKRDGGSAIIKSLVVDTDNNRLFVGGCFDSLPDGQTTTGGANWDGMIWSNNGHPICGSCTIPCPNSPISMIYLDNKGYASSQTAVSRSFVHVFPTSGIGIGTATADVNDLCWWNGKLVAVGNFNKMNNVTCHGIAVYDTTTQVWSALGQGMTFGSTIDCCYNWNGKLIIGGTFGQIDGVNCNSVAMYDTTGVDHWTNLGGGVDQSGTGEPVVNCFEIYNGDLYVGGLFDGPCHNFAKFNGTDWVNPLSAGASIGNVICMTVFNQKLIIAIGSQPGIFEFDGTNLSTEMASIWGIYSFAIYNGELIAGGLFDVNSQGDTLNNIARWSNLDIQKINAVCSDDCNGTASVQAIGPAPYHYQWNTPNNDTTQIVNNLCPGTYQVIVTDSFGQLHYGTTVITHSDSVGLNSTVTNATCATCANGSATISISNGTAPYEILWSTGDTLQTISNQLPGSYTVCVKDSNKCVVCDTVVINFNNGVNEIESREFIITPNPTEGLISISGTKTGEQILCENLMGQVVYSTICTNEKTMMDVSELTSGVYFLVITDRDGVVVGRKKIVKE